jgi:hypothetical protein
MMRLRILFQTPIFLVVSACCSCPPASHSQVAPSVGAAATPLFPLGQYRHDVKIHINETEKSKAKDFSFQGLAKIEHDKLELVVLSPFQTTLMKIDENRLTGDVQTQVYSDALKKYQDKFTPYYALLRQILVLPRSGEDPIEVTLVPDPSQSSIQADSLPNEVVKFSEYRDHVPHLVEMSDPHFSLQMKVESL